MAGQDGMIVRTIVSIFDSSVPFSRACLSSLWDGTSAVLSWWTCSPQSAPELRRMPGGSYQTVRVLEKGRHGADEDYFPGPYKIRCLLQQLCLGRAAIGRQPSMAVVSSIGGLLRGIKEGAIVELERGRRRRDGRKRRRGVRGEERRLQPQESRARVSVLQQRHYEGVRCRKSMVVLGLGARSAS